MTKISSHFWSGIASAPGVVAALASFAKSRHRNRAAFDSVMTRSTAAGTKILQGRVKRSAGSINAHEEKPANRPRECECATMSSRGQPSWIVIDCSVIADIHHADATAAS